MEELYAYTWKKVNNMTTKVNLHVRIEGDLLKEVDKVRKDTTRSVLIERAVQRYLTLIEGGIRRRKRA